MAKKITQKTSENEIKEEKIIQTDDAKIKSQSKITSEEKTDKAPNNLINKPITAIAVFLLICIAIFGVQNIRLSSRLKSLERHVSEMENSLSQNVDENRKIYVFNMDETVKGVGLQETNQKFEQDINDLDAQVKEAQATIQDLKDEAMKVRILNLSIKPLQIKRDDLLDAYAKSMQSALAQINDALAEISTENNVPTIFMNKAVAVNTNYVVDVTSQVIEKVKAKMQENKN